MKSVLFTCLTIVSISCWHFASAQCSNITGDINTNTYVCGLDYGDANGNSTWQWELPSTDGPTYCSQWYARTDNTSNETLMGSPWSNPTTFKLKAIVAANDYTHANGWELLVRNFGCSRPAAYPFFALYNKYSGLIRFFIFQPIGSPQYSGMTLQIEPVTSVYPATTATGDPIQTAPDKYLGSGSKPFGLMAMSVCEPAGSGLWSVGEFYPGFDPNIYNAVYSGAALKVTIYGVQTYALQAKIGGTLTTSTQSNLMFSPKTAPTTNPSGLTSINAFGEQFTTFGKDVSDIRTSLNATATGVTGSHPADTATSKSPLGQVAAGAKVVAQLTSDAGTFGAYVGDVANVLDDAGGVFKLAGAIIGLFSSKPKTPAAAPLYTNVNLTLQGSLTAKDVSETFIVNVPGTAPNSTSDAPYYQCPLGIFNITATPQADTVVYTRPLLYVSGGDITQIKYAAYKITNNIPVAFNDGAGLDLVSVKAAIMVKILPDATGKASYDPFAPGKVPQGAAIFGTVINWLLPDLESGRLQTAFFDTSAAHLHILQTPYVNLQCLQGLSVNVPQTSNVYLRIKASLKQKDDPDNTPIVYVQDYLINCNQATLPLSTRQTLNGPDGALHTPPPYALYSVMPSFIPDVALSEYNFDSPITIEADNSITLGPSVAVFSQNVVMEAGNAIYLEPGFIAFPGSSFQAIVDNYGYTPPACGTLQITAFDPNTNCYNTVMQPLGKKADTVVASGNLFDNTNSSVNVYPNPARDRVTITGLDGIGHATLTVIDQSGRAIYAVEKQDESPTMELNVTGLSSGVYFVNIKGTTRTLIRKIVVAH